MPSLAMACPDDDDRIEAMPRGLPGLAEFLGTCMVAEGKAAPTLGDVERWAIQHAMHACGRNKTLAAERLGISLKTLYNKLNRFALERRAAS